MDGYGGPVSFIATDGDCSDPGEADGRGLRRLRRGIYPGAAEVADDGVDSDCDGTDSVTCYVDSDGDGYGSMETTVSDGACTGDFVSSVSTDCDDLSSSTYPGAVDTPDDGIDQDCSGVDSVTCFVDGDGDGYGASSTLVATDGDCDGEYETAIDGDCDDGDAARHPAMTESCDAIDSDCDGDVVDTFTDTDGDLSPDCIDEDDDDDVFPDVVDCEPLDASIFPGAIETCDFVDSDCDGSLVDEFDDTDGDTMPDCVDTDDDGDFYPDEVDCGPTTRFTLAPKSSAMPSIRTATVR